MPKEISFGSEARNKIKSGIDKASAAVSPTLGAVGMAAIIDWEGLDPIVSDDGVTILKNLEFTDKYENLGLKMLRKAAIRTSVEGGDGTATTTVLAQAIVQEAFKEIANDSSKIQDVKERLQRGLDAVLGELSKIKREVTEEDIEKIATISSLDSEVAKLIAEIIKEVGVNGIVTVERGSGIGYTKEIVKGARFDKGLISPYFITDFEREEAVLENPAIVLVDRTIAVNEHVQGLMQSIGKSGNLSVLFIADDVQGIALATLIKNQLARTFKIACVQNPHKGSRSKDFLADMGALTGATVISEEAGMKLDTATVEHCGKSERVIVTKDHCTIVGGNASEALKDRVASIEKQLSETTSEYSKLILEERLACLTGGIGVIRVGAYTDTDFNAKKYKFENAINSTQAALQEGILPGGGTALIKASKGITDNIFLNALVTPLKQMAINAGMDWYEVVNNVKNGSPIDCGYNFIEKKLCNQFDTGIIDPYKVVRLALESAVSIAMTLITTEVAIMSKLEEKDGKQSN